MEGLSPDPIFARVHPLLSLEKPNDVMFQASAQRKGRSRLLVFLLTETAHFLRPGVLIHPTEQTAHLLLSYQQAAKCQALTEHENAFFSPSAPALS